MPTPKIVKLTRKDDLPAVIKHIKTLRDRDIVFDVEEGSALLTSPESLRLIKKTGEVLGKKIKIQTMDPASQGLARKAGILAGASEVKIPKQTARARSDIKPPMRSGQPANRARFSDIVGPKRTARVAPQRIEAKSAAAEPVDDYGSRYEIELGKKSSSFSKFFILGLVVLVVAVFGLAVLLPQADITVFARSEPITRDFEIVVDRSVPVVDTNSLSVPGIQVSKEVSQTKSFPATGTKTAGTKASGTVTIYNFTANTLTLKATTTTLVAGGKKYLFTKDVAGIKPNGVANTGIPIISEGGGVDYNLAANTKFQLVNAALGKANVYAMNPTALTGGFTSASTKVLSAQDFDNAANSLIADIITTAESDLTAENSAKIRLLDSGIKKEVLAKTANKNVGDATDSFDMTLVAKVTGLAFKEDNITTVIVSKINEVLSPDKYLLENGQKPFTANYKSIDLSNGKGVLSVHFETTAAYKVDSNDMPKILAGKNESEIKEILLSKPEIDNVQVKFWPEWFVHKAPRFNGKINISTILSQ